MKSVEEFDHRITIGSAPTGREVILLASMGFRTFIDLRSDEDADVEMLRRHCLELEKVYIRIPISPFRIDFEDVLHFYLAAFESGRAPIYAFSRFGRRPLAFLLLLEAVVDDRPVTMIFTKARRMGFELEEDELLKDFLVDFRDRWRMKETVELLRHLRPDLIPRRSSESHSAAG